MHSTLTQTEEMEAESQTEIDDERQLTEEKIKS